MNPVISQKRSITWPALAAAIAACAVLGACGEPTNGTTNATTSPDQNTALPSQQVQHVAVRLQNSTREKHSDGQNDLLDLRGDWASWGDDSSTISFDAQTNRLRITRPTDSSGISLGVRRFDGELTAGNWYSLTVDAAGSGAAALLFLIDRDGQISPAVTDANGALLLATDNNPLSFTAPANVVGFYLQVQSGYRATTDASLVANVITQLVPDPSSAPDPNGELIDIDQQWPHWDGTASPVSYDSQSARLRIDAPENGNAIGARKIGVGLQAGKTYQLTALQSTDPSASVLLFLFDAQHQVIPFRSATNQTPWLATGTAARTFIAPDGVANIGIQVQSGYQADNPTYLTPSLRITADTEPDPTETPVAPPEQPVPERAPPAPPNE